MRSWSLEALPEPSACTTKGTFCDTLGGMSPHEFTRAVLYIRVSTGKQVEHGHSLDAQRERLMAYADRHVLQVVDVIVDGGESAGTLNRPGLRRALDMIEAGEADVLVATKGDRISRNLRDLLNLAATLAEHDASIATADGTFDTTTPMGMAMTQMQGVFAQLERAMASERTREGMAAAKAKGVRLGRPPFGYMVVDGELVLDPSKADELERRRQLARRIVELQGEGQSLRQIAEALAADGTPTPTGRGSWTAAAVSRAAKLAA